VSTSQRVRSQSIIKKIAFCGAALMLPATVFAHQECGTVTKSIRLKSDCRGPLVVGADRITVDLNGYTILAPKSEEYEGRGAVEVFNKHGVTVTNGTINGLSVGLYVKGGHQNRFSNLTARSIGEGGTYARFEEVKNTVISRVSIRGFEDTSVFRFTGRNSALSQLSLINIDGSPLAFIQGKNLVISNSTFSGGFTGTCSPTLLRISNSTVWSNTFTGGAGGPSSGLCLEGDRNRVKYNSIVSRSGSGFTLINGKNNWISYNSMSAGQMDPPTIVDIDGGADACKNRWWNNSFVTDSEGDGPKRGCIR
jgi:hypothetical protein